MMDSRLVYMGVALIVVWLWVASVVVDEIKTHGLKSMVEDVWCGERGC